MNMSKLLPLYVVMSGLSLSLAGQTPDTLRRENLGAGVNSTCAELTPFISPDGKKLFFVRENDPQNVDYPEPGTQDVFMSKLDSAGNWGAARHLGYPFNADKFNAVIGFSADGNTRYVKGYYDNGEYKTVGFSSCVLTVNGWSKPQGFHVKNYQFMQDKSETVSNYMHNDNKTLLMSFTPRKKKEHDIFVSFRIDADHFTEPMSLPINTDNVEMSPFLASDGVTLYFSSNRPGGFGSNDIWMTRRLDDTWQKWSDPVNLGAGVNTPQWDSYYSIAASGDCAYMVSYANTYGHSDIVRISLRPAVRPNPVALVSGRVLDKKTNKPIDAAITFTTLSDGKEAGTAHTTPGTGDYQIILPYGKLYGFSASAQGYYAVSENLDLTNLASYEEVKRDLYLVPIEVGQVVRLNNIFFEFGKDSLKSESFVELDNVVKLLTDNPSMHIALSGHTDNVGSDAANLKLSEGRAKAVYNYLVSKGIDATRLSSKGFGETKPVSTNDTEDGRQQNRRVEFEIETK